MANYHLTNKAVSDLDSFWDYTFITWGERQADDYYNSLISTFASIAKRPCYLDREYGEIHTGLYCRFCRKHMVFYRLVKYGDVEIVAKLQ